APSFYAEFAIVPVGTPPSKIALEPLVLKIAARKEIKQEDVVAVVQIEGASDKALGFSGVVWRSVRIENGVERLGQEVARPSEASGYVVLPTIVKTALHGTKEGEEYQPVRVRVDIAEMADASRLVQGLRAIAARLF